jgi:hypothetical protein
MKYIILLMLAACGPLQKPKDPKETTKIEQLRTAYQERLAEAYKVFDEKTHWPSMKDCDATLWTGIAVAGGVKANLALAEHSPGEIHRRPHRACWTDKEGDIGSKSTVSKDMLQGYLLGLWESRDLEAAKRLQEYGEKHNWVMGKPFPQMASRVVMSFNQKVILTRMLYVMSDGAIKKNTRHFAPVYFGVKKDYERHIQAISLLMNGELRERAKFKDLAVTSDEDQQPVDLRKSELEHAKDLAAKEPWNFLYNYILAVYSGDYEKTIDLLLDEKNPVPTYVRGDGENYYLAEWLFVANKVLHRYGTNWRNLRGLPFSHRAHLFAII